MKNYIENYVEIRVRIKRETRDLLIQQSKKNNESVSGIVRNILSQNLSQEAVIENINTVNDLVRRVVRDIIRVETDRLAKLIIKTMKASAAGMYLSAQAVEDIGQNKGSEILEEAFNLAVKYIKVLYDPKDYAEVPLKTAKSETVTINMADLSNITDEEFLNMTI